MGHGHIALSTALTSHVSAAFFFSSCHGAARQHASHQRAGNQQHAHQQCREFECVLHLLQFDARQEVASLFVIFKWHSEHKAKVEVTAI
jgi:hypothetical protein